MCLDFVFYSTIWNSVRKKWLLDGFHSPNILLRHVYKALPWIQRQLHLHHFHLHLRENWAFSTHPELQHRSRTPLRGLFLTPFLWPAAAITPSLFTAFHGCVYFVLSHVQFWRSAEYFFLVQSGHIWSECIVCSLQLLERWQRLNGSGDFNMAETKAGCWRFSAVLVDHEWEQSAGTL